MKDTPLAPGTGHFAGRRSREEEARLLRKADDAEKVLQMAALQAQRKSITQLARHNRVSDDVSRKLLREIDPMDARYR